MCLARVSAISLCRGTGWLASHDAQFTDLVDAGDLTGGEFLIDIEQVLAQLIHGLGLSPVVRMLGMMSRPATTPNPVPQPNTPRAHARNRGAVFCATNALATGTNPAAPKPCSRRPRTNQGWELLNANSTDPAATRAAPSRSAHPPQRAARSPMGSAPAPRVSMNAR